jgi:hypothetical protein
MSKKESKEKGPASWLLRGQQPMMGDLLEQYAQGRSCGWFWRQVLVGLFWGGITAAASRWLEIGFSIAGSALLLLTDWPDKIYESASDHPWLWRLESDTGLVVSYLNMTAWVLSATLAVWMLLIAFLAARRTANWKNVSPWVVR